MILLKKSLGKKPSAGKSQHAHETESKRLQFVIQEHHASHLHWDFRLEWNGLLKSWAIPKGPSMNTNDKRLAIEVEDHPLDYGSFHGIIPKGEYGAGKVYIWDRGTWLPENPGVSADLKKGHLNFRLKGKRLSGNWSLIRFHGKGQTRQTQWLLIYKGNSEFSSKSKATERDELDDVKQRS